MTTHAPPSLPLAGYAGTPEFACLSIDDIIVDADVNPRLQADHSTVRRLIAALEKGELLPPPIVFRDEDGNIIMADGFGRLQAHIAAEKSTIDVEIREGSRRDATLCGIKTNANHGRKLSAAEKRRAITTIFNEAAWCERSDREIASLCGCSPPTVAQVRKTHPIASASYDAEHRVVRTKGGGHRKQRVKSGKAHSKAHALSVRRPNPPPA